MAQNQPSTVFLTQWETTRIRSLVQDRLKKCAELRGQARQMRESKASISEATLASLMADMGTFSKQESTIPAVVVGQPYPPCVSPPSALQAMRLAELRLDTHHAGFQLAVERAGPVVTQAARSWAFVRDCVDPGDDVERLEVCLHKTMQGKDVLESSQHFIIKEPYFTINDSGQATLLIDHPSDLVVVREDALVKQKPADAAAAAEAARKAKDMGNSALKKQNFPLAHAHYTSGIEVARDFADDEPEMARLVRDMHRNRAHVNLLLVRFDEAMSDARDSLIGADDSESRELDAKAHFRAGSAAYALGDYDAARRSFEVQRALAPESDSARAYLKKVEQRERERDAGAYDWPKLRVGLSQTRPRVDAASFVGNTAVRPSPGRGRGLFAARDVAAGDLVMAEKAFCVVWGFEDAALTAMTYDVRDDLIRLSPVGLTRATVEKLLCAPSQMPRVMDLFGDYTSAAAHEPVPDVFRVHDIVSRNAFGPGPQFGDESADRASAGLWVVASYMNHSCVPNATKDFVGDVVLVRAARDIKAGEELFHAYVETSDYDARQAALATTWGFQCECVLCAVEKEEETGARKKRRDLVRQADDFVAREGWAGAKRITVRRAEQLAKAIGETYDGARYKGLPRMGRRTIDAWLSRNKGSTG